MYTIPSKTHRDVCVKQISFHSPAIYFILPILVVSFPLVDRGACCSEILWKPQAKTAAISGEYKRVSSRRYQRGRNAGGLVPSAQHAHIWGFKFISWGAC